MRLSVFSFFAMIHLYSSFGLRADTHSDPGCFFGVRGLGLGRFGDWDFPDGGVIWLSGLGFAQI